MQLFIKYKYLIHKEDSSKLNGDDYLEELVLKAKKNDKEAFTQIILVIRNDLYKLARVRLSNEEDIQDVIQETMIEAYKKIKQLKEPTKFKFWIIKILINNCNKKYRKKKKENSIFNEYEQNGYYLESYNNIEDINHTLDFYRMLKNLDYDERTIIILFYNEKYTSKEISDLLNMNENTVKSKIFRAKQKIKNNYKEGVKNG